MTTHHTSSDLSTAEISIIIPIYNVKDTLRKCIESLQAQTCENWVAICVDDGSTDGSGELIDELAAKDKRLKVIHKSNGGVSSARNLGLEQVTTPYVTMLDSDDWLEPEALQRLIEITQKGDCEFIMYGVCRMYKDGHTFPRPYNRPSGTYTAVPVRLFQLHNMLGIAGKCYKTSIIKQHHLTFPEGLKVAEDYHFNILYWTHIKECVVLNDCLYNYYESDSSIMVRYEKGLCPYERYAASINSHRFTWQAISKAKVKTYSNEQWLYALMFSQGKMLRYICRWCDIPAEWKKSLKRLETELCHNYAQDVPKWRALLYRAKINTYFKIENIKGLIRHFPARLRGYIKHKIAAR